MIEIQLLNIVTTIHNLNNLHEHALDEELSYRVPGAMFSPQFRRGFWDGKKHLYKFSTKKHPFGKFQTGLVSRVIDIFDRRFPNEIVKVIDNRVRPNQQHPLLLPGFELHDYEQEAVNIAVDRSRGLFRLPTGAGKSVVEAALIARLNVPTLLVSHRIDILQHLKTIAEKALGFEIGIIQGQQRELKRFNVAMIQTIKSCLKNAATNESAFNVVKFIQEQCQCLIVDEAHHLQSDTYALLANRAFNSYYRFGFSATIEFNKPEDMLVEAGFGRVQMRMTPSSLVKQRKLSKPYIFFVDYHDDTVTKKVVDSCFDCGCTAMQEIKRAVGRSKKKADEDTEDSFSDEESELSRTVFKCTQCGKEWTSYSDAAIRCLVKNKKRNNAIVAIAERQIRKNRSVLILVTYIEHGKSILEMLSSRVDPSKIDFVFSETEDRKDLLQQLKRKEKLCLIATTVYGEGIDVPSLSTLINARASGSVIDTMQAVGRALRRSDGKWKTLVIDFQDKSKYFKGKAKARFQLLSAEPEFVVKQIPLPNDLRGL